MLVAVCARVASPGPKFAAGMPCAAKRATSVQPSLARTSSPFRSISERSNGCVSAGGAPSAQSTISNVSPSTASAKSSSRSHRLGVGQRSDRARSDGSRASRARSGTTLPATPPSTSTACTASRYSQPSMTGRRSSYDSSRSSTDRTGGSRCVPSRAEPCARGRRRGRSRRASCPGTPPRSCRRSVRRGGRRRRRADRDARRTADASPLWTRVDLLGFVEHVRDVDGGIGAPCAASSSITARPDFMSDAPQPHSVSPSIARRPLSLIGTVSVCPAMTSRSGRPRSVRATTLLPSWSTVSHGVAASSPDPLGDRPLVVADRRDADEISGQREQVGHATSSSDRCAVVAQDRFELALVVTLALVAGA